MTDNTQRNTAARRGRPDASPARRERAGGGATEAVFTARRSFARGAASVWRLLARLDNPDLAKGFSRIAVEGAGEGAVRSLWLAGPQEGVIRERIESFDERARACTYRVFEFGPMPFEAYVGRLRVKAVAGRGCQLLYRARFVRAATVCDQEARAIVRGSFERLCANIAAALR